MSQILNNTDNPGVVLIDGHDRADIALVRALGIEDVPVYLATDKPKNAMCYSRFKAGGGSCFD